jgi:hypothetical protein
MNKLCMYVLLLACVNNAFTMDIVKGKKYKTNGGTLVTIVGDCKEIFGVDSLETIGDQATNPACLAYLKRCIEESRNTLLATAYAEQVASGDQAALRICLAEKYRGNFYYAKGAVIGMCVHPSWLTPVDNVDRDEIKKQHESVIGDDWE